MARLFSMDAMNTKTTLSGRALKALRSTCPHANVIELGDGVRVCTRCEAVYDARRAGRRA